MVHMRSAMQRSQVDEQFERFRDRGDPAALGQVFDATAAELLRLAWHLTGDRHAAEDAVQATFLSAIEQAQTFEPGRPVLPWLCGMLVNRVREARRRARTVSRGGPGQDAGVEPDPHERAAMHELAAAARERLQALPEPYRQVLILFVDHGLSAREIAELRGQPPATVRSQVHRALEMLRRALPAALAVAGAGTAPLWAAGQLAALRSAVLSHAAPGATAAGSIAVTGGVLVMKKTLAIALLLGLALVSLWFADPFMGRPAQPAEHRGRTPAEPGVAAGSQALPADSQRVARQELAAPQPVTQLRVKVRSPAGAPAAGHTVHWIPQHPDATLLERAAKTDAGGVAEFSGILAGPATVLVDRGGSAQVTVEEARRTDVEVVLAGTVQLQVLVTDQRARPIPGASVWVSRRPSQMDDGTVLGATGTKGRFDAGAIAGGHLVSAWADGFAPAPVKAVPPDGEEASELRFELRPAPGSLHGRVVDSSGQPVQNAIVLVGNYRREHLVLPLRDESWHSPSRLARTDERGEFRLGGLHGTSYPQLIWARALGFAVTLERVPISGSGPTRIEIRLREGATVSGCVKNARGAPVGARIRALHEEIEPEPHQAFQAPPWARVESMAGADGAYVLANLLPGVCRVVAESGADFADACLRLGDLESSEWNPILGSGREIEGVVVSEEGSPLVGWRVRGECGKGVPPLGEVRTDALGGFRLTRACDATYELFVFAPASAMSAEAVRRAGVQPDAAPLRIVVPAGKRPSGELTGYVLDPAGEPLASGTLLLVCFGSDGSSTGAASGDRSVVDGRFRISPLTPGHYEIALQSDEFGRCYLGAVDVPADGVVDIGTYRIPTPGGLRVTVVRADGKPTQHSVVVRRDGDRQSFLTTGFLAPAELKQLQPGKYFVTSWGTEMPGVTTTVEVRSGQLFELRLVAPIAHAIRVRYPKAPVDDYWVVHRWFDQEGQLVFETGGGRGLRAGQEHVWPYCLPAGRYTVEVCDGTGATGKAEVVVDPADPERIFDLPVPKR